MPRLDLERSLLDEVLARAAAVRDAAWGRTITYSRKVFIPLTTLCRDVCGYCVFARPPGAGGRFLDPDEVLAVAEAGRRAGCKEALFTLGERPEDRHEAAREALRRFGHRTTIDYLREMCGRVLDETGLVPHANPGAMTEEEVRSLAPVCGSMGVMMENLSPRLGRSGAPHHACPDKAPARRLETLEAAGRAGVPFTTGILVGIGETFAERVETLLRIGESHARHGHVQEVIVQNFRAKPGTPMADAPEPGEEETLRSIAAARLILPPEVAVQAPPNLADGEGAWAAYIDAGINDWGGVSPVTRDHVNPERAWPEIPRLAAATSAKGFVLRERLTVYPRHLGPGRFSAAVAERLAALSGPDGLARSQAHLDAAAAAVA